MELRCTAKNRSGERCGRTPIRGGTVCILHGGNTEHARRAAQLRLIAMVEPALEALLRALQSAPPCPHCGRSDADRDPSTIRAAQLVLDRAGFGPSATLNLEPVNAKPLANMTPAQLAAEAETLAREVREMASRAEVIDVGEIPLDDMDQSPNGMAPSEQQADRSEQVTGRKE